MHAAIAALARKHGWSPEVAAEVDGAVRALAAPGDGADADRTEVIDLGSGSGHTFGGDGLPRPEPGPPGRYEVLGLLGAGGMGEVQRVRDLHLDRIVARKVMHEAWSEAARARFLEEARTTAQLQHPGIVPVYDVGAEDDGRPWFTMKEVRGETLRAVIHAEHEAAFAAPGEQSVGLRRLVTIFQAVCRAVGFAHERGVVHRDLKPTNVMVGAHGEVLVLDWGIAKVLAEPAAAAPADRPRIVRERGEQTQVGALMGTPAFMAPEQARGEVAAIDARTDVYALGAVLYEVLTADPPYRGPGWSVVHQVVSGPPPTLRGPAGDEARARFGVDLAELVEISERAMAREPSERFPDGTALGEAVQSWLDGSRRREQALAVVASAAAKGPEAAALRARAAALRAEAEAALKGIEDWQPEEDKAGAWAQADAAVTLEQEAELAELAAEQLLRASLTHAPDLPEAHAGLAERHRRAHEAAEAAREVAAKPEALLRQHLGALPESHPARQSGLAYLRGDGALTLLTDPPGAEVELHRFETRNRRLVAVPDRSLGRTPLRAQALPRGSYLCVVRHPERAPVRYPVFLGRGEHWDGVPPEGGNPAPVLLPRPEALGPEDCYVPAGWFWSGGDRLAAMGLPHRRLWLDGFVVRRFPVTNREYLAFLDALVADGREAEALRHAPRQRPGSVDEPGALLYGFDGRRFSLRPDGEGDTWHPEWPVLYVDWPGASAFAAWEASRTGRPWRLPGEIEWEKAARGVDGRWFPWGDRQDPSWSCMRQSHRGRPLPVVVDSYPVDESVYGVRGCGGNVRGWCADAFRPQGPPQVSAAGRVGAPDSEGDPHLARVYRGGSWNFDALRARVAFRFYSDPGYRDSYLGLRVARPIP